MRSAITPTSQLGKWRHGEVKHLAQGLLLVIGKAEVQTLAMWLWLLEVLTTGTSLPLCGFQAALYQQGGI